jgi:hypothetical protein
MRRYGQQRARCLEKDGQLKEAADLFAQLDSHEVRMSLTRGQAAHHNVGHQSADGAWPWLECLQDAGRCYGRAKLYAEAVQAYQNAGDHPNVLKYCYLSENLDQAVITFQAKGLAPRIRVGTTCMLLKGDGIDCRLHSKRG